MRGRIRNPRGLRLPGSDDVDISSNNGANLSVSGTDTIVLTSPENSPLRSGGGSLNNFAYGSDNVSQSLCIDKLQYEFSQLECTDMQKDRMNEFFADKKAIAELSNETLINEHELGAGTGGVVWLSRRRDTDICLARKMIQLDVKTSVRNQVMRELTVLHECNSPYIVGFYGAFIHDNLISLCMEYMDGGSFDRILKIILRVPELILGDIACAVLQGLSYMREKHRYIHRDVKPSNILVNSRGEIKLCDFSVSGKLVDSMANTFVGTRSYMSPERLDGSPYTVQSDIWSLGISLVEMAIGNYPLPFPPFEIETVMSQDPLCRRPRDIDDQTPMAIFELLGYISNMDGLPLPREYFSDDFCEFIDICLRKNANERTDLRSLQALPFTFASASTDQLSRVAVWIRDVKAIAADDADQLDQNGSG